MRTMLGFVVGGALLTITPAFAHVTLAVKELPIGADYKAVFRVRTVAKGQRRSN